MQNKRELYLQRLIRSEGNGDEIGMFPPSFRGYCSVYEGDLDEAWDDYCVYGGLPLILLRETAEDKAMIVVRDNSKPRRGDMGILTVGIRNFSLDENNLES